MTPSSPIHSAPADTEALRFLSSPRSYGPDVRHFEVIETHHAWVFLVDRCCYKMKKSVASPPRGAHYPLDARKHLCDEEYRLNHCLSPNTYLGVVPLTMDDSGDLHIGGDGLIVEWLVKMRRLPDDCFVHRAAKRDAVSNADVRRIVATLVDFYREAPQCLPGRVSYVSRLQSEIAETGKALGDRAFGFDVSAIEDHISAMKDYLTAHASMVESRHSDGLVREVHGDLRPEHVCLLPDRVEIIDRLEFDADLRCLDCVEDLAYFCMECRCMGQGWIEPVCIDAYESLSGDRAPQELWRFYSARRACVRAMLCTWHSRDDTCPEHWRGRARHYLALAGDSIAAT